MAPKTIAIIGAGPAGLITAKILLRSKPALSQYKIHVFDKQSSVGGLWAVDPEKPYDGMLNPYMPTNISRFNIGFSDHPWEVDATVFPRAWRVGGYLRGFAEGFLGDVEWRLGTRVTGVVRGGREGEDGEGAGEWCLRWETRDEMGGVREGEGGFDFLVMGAGFFPRPFIPEIGVRIGDTASTIRQIHSTKIRSLSDLVSKDTAEPATVLIVGGGMSGSETASSLALERSNAMYAPGSSGSAYKNVRLVQIVPAPFYALPLMVPRVSDDEGHLEAPEFVPLDLALYDLGRRPPGEIELGIGKLSHEFVRKSHQYMRGVVGGDHSELGQPAMVYEDTETDTTRVAIAEKYAEFLRSGVIELVDGRFAGLGSGSEGRGGVATVTGKDGRMKSVENVVGIVWATGFSATPSVNILPKEILDRLEYDPESERLPLILDLDQYYTARNDVPGLAFIGYHEGQAYAGMELQARFVEKMVSEDVSKSETNVEATKNEKRESGRQKLRELRKSMQAREGEVPMYWLGDYAGLVSSLARDVGIKRNDLDWPERSGPVVAARYADEQSDPHAVKQTLDELDTLLRHSKEKARFVARAAFRALHGSWKISRQLNSRLPGFPSGSLSGTATFHPRYPTDPAYDAEYLYIEQGVFKNDQGLAFTASRRYIYRYKESSDKISSWFVKDDGKTVDYFFHDLMFDPSDREGGWKAETDHLCVKDLYKSTYRFVFAGMNVRKFEIVHGVKGPQKDYVSSTEYVRGPRELAET